MTADGPPRCLWRIRDCALSCRLFPSAGGGLRFCNIVEAPRDSGGVFFCGAAVRAALLPVLPDG